MTSIGNNTEREREIEIEKGKYCQPVFLHVGGGRDEENEGGVTREKGRKHQSMDIRQTRVILPREKAWIN